MRKLPQEIIAACMAATLSGAALGLAFLPTDEGFVSFQGLAPATQRTDVNKPCRGVMDRVLHFATP